MSEVAVLVPVVGRPDRIEPLVESLKASMDVGFSVWFVCDRGDHDTLRVVEALRRVDPERVRFWKMVGGYAAKINVAVGLTREPLVFLAADDLEFRPGWFENAKVWIDRGAEVVGVNDLIDRRRSHATHFLMTRGYAEQPTVDNKPGPLCTVYRHWFCDDELIATARKRGVYAYAKDSHVRHLHPMNGTAPDDAIYRRGRRHARADRSVFRQRARMWT